MTKRPPPIDHEHAVKAIFQRLQKKYPGLENVSHLRDPATKVGIDIEGRINGKQITVIVYDHEEFRKNGKLKATTKVQLDRCFDKLEPEKDKGGHRWLIFTDFQAFHQWIKIKEVAYQQDSRKTYPYGKNSSTSRQSARKGGTNWWVDPHRGVKCILFPFPVIVNNGWSKSKATTLTFSHILTALKFGFLNNDERLFSFEYKTPDAEIQKDKVSTNTSKPTTSTETWSVGRLVEFFLEKRKISSKRSSKKAKTKQKV